MSCKKLRFQLRTGVSAALLTLAGCGGGASGGSSAAPASAGGTSVPAAASSTTVVTTGSGTAEQQAPVTTAAGAVVDATTETAGNVADAVTSTAGDVAGGAASAVGTVVDAVADSVGKAASGAGAVIGDVVAAVGDATGGDLGSTVDDLVDAISDQSTGSGGSASAGAPVPAAADAAAPLLDTLLTRSGHWRLTALPAQGDAAVYHMTLDEKPGFEREFACRRIFTKEKGDTTALDLATVTLLGVPTTVPQGACRVVQNMEPVSPHGEWIRQAVAEGVIPAYRRERAIRPALFKPLAVDAKLAAYDPTSLGGASSNSNYVGVTSNQGGEYASSRGFLHDADARVVDAALHGEDGRIAAVWAQFTAYTFYSLAQPQGAAWSAVNHGTVDPQFPQPGDRPWEAPIWNNPNPAVDSMQDTTGWVRDVAHLENTGFIHWLATEDPIAGLVVQRQAAYALASFFENYRGGYGTMKPLATYAGTTGQERGLFNTLSALWKSRDVARRVASAAGTTIWSLARTERQADEVIAYYDNFANRFYNATTAAPADYAAKISGTLFGGQGTEPYNMADGTQQSFSQASAFMLQQYGKEPLWLWTKAGDKRVARWFTTYARSMAVRMTVIGGARGIDCNTGVRGSGFPIGPTTKSAQGWTVAALPSFTTDTGWGQWAASIPLKVQGPRDSFNGAALHTALQTEGLLLMAKDAQLSVPDLDTALANIARWKAATSSYSYESLQMMKHMASPN